MKKIIKENLPLERFELSPEEATALMEQEHQPYKVELIAEHSGKGEKISFYRQGEYTDLCAGPHLMSTGNVRLYALLIVRALIGAEMPIIKCCSACTASPSPRRRIWTLI